MVENLSFEVGEEVVVRDEAREIIRGMFPEVAASLEKGFWIGTVEEIEEGRYWLAFDATIFSLSFHPTELWHLKG